MTCTCLVGRSNKAARQLALATRSSCEQYKIVCERVLELPCPLLLKTVLKAELGADSVLVPLRWCYSNTSFAPCAWSRGSRKPLVRFRASLRGSWAGHGVSRAAMPSRIVEKIANKLAFFPPTPATYELAHESTGAQELFIQALSPPFMCAHAPLFVNLLILAVLVLPLTRIQCALSVFRGDLLRSSACATSGYC